MPLPTRLLALSCCLLVTYPAFGWWETGHQTVARIAALHLTPAARVRISRILGVPDTTPAVADALAKASTWADETKADTNTGEWHYIDLTLQDSEKQIPERCENDNCVTARITLFSKQLAAEKGPGFAGGRWSEADALRFLVHFVGDIHQPLHAISDEDLGGNCEQLNPPIGDAKNVHALWDGELVRALSNSDQQLAADLDGYIAKLDDATRTQWSAGGPNEWAWESHQIAREQIYGKLHIPIEPVGFPHGCKEAPAEITNFHPVVDTLYIDSMKPIVRDQLSKAGLRLAHVLNEAL
jgi:hypothetical protein